MYYKLKINTVYVGLNFFDFSFAQPKHFINALP